MRRITLLLTAFLSTTALAVPLEFNHQGRLFDDTGAPIDAATDLQFDLFDTSTGGSALWTEAHPAVTFDNGYYSVQLGQTTALDTDVFAANDTLFIEISVDGTAAGRLPVVSVPYALVAGGVSGGIVDASEIRVGGTTVIDSSGTLDGGALPGTTLGDLICSDGELAVFDSGTWDCQAGAGAHNHSANDITSDTLDINRLPVGTGTGQVAAGDHTHSALDITSDTLDINRLPVGTGSGQIAAGDHTHNSTPGDFTVGGAVTVADSSATCDGTSGAGAIRWNGSTFEGCTGAGGWAVLGGIRDGSSAGSAGASCVDILTAVPGASDGVYWLDPDTDGPGAPYQTECDMGNGGWTLVVRMDPAVDGTCPGDWALHNTGPTGNVCRRAADTCGQNGAVFDTHGLTWTEAQGYVTSYSYGSMDGYSDPIRRPGICGTTTSIDSEYLDGISLTYDEGGGRQHLWDYALAGGTAGAETCPTTGDAPPGFVGANFSCAVAPEGTSTTPATLAFTTADTFSRTLPSPVVADIEIRSFTGQEAYSNEDAWVDSAEIWVR